MTRIVDRGLRGGLKFRQNIASDQEYSAQFANRLGKLRKALLPGDLPIIMRIREGFFVSSQYEVRHERHVATVVGALEDSLRAYPGIFLQELPTVLEVCFPNLKFSYAIFEPGSPFPNTESNSYGKEFAWSKTATGKYVCYRKEDNPHIERSRVICQEMVASTRGTERQRMDDDLIVRKMESQGHYLGVIVLHKTGSLAIVEKTGLKKLIEELSELLHASQILNRERDTLLRRTIGISLGALEYGLDLSGKILDRILK